jgi:hypothetical protein
MAGQAARWELYRMFALGGWARFEPAHAVERSAGRSCRIAQSDEKPLNSGDLTGRKKKIRSLAGVALLGKEGL